MKTSLAICESKITSGAVSELSFSSSDGKPFHVLPGPHPAPMSSLELSVNLRNRYVEAAQPYWTIS
jgi:hypothetical protein